jgi:hypothetical protein
MSSTPVTTEDVPGNVEHGPLETVTHRPEGRSA